MLLSYDMQIVYIAYLLKILRKGKKKLMEPVMSRSRCRQI